MSRTRLVPIVEGHGDVDSIRVLVGLICPAVEVGRPLRVPKSKMLDEAGTLARYTRLARSEIVSRVSSGIVLLLDADEGCPAEVGPRLLGEMRDAAGDVRIFVAMAVREYESWLVGGIEELGIDEPEIAGKAKDRLREFNGGRYKETVDQPRLTSRIDVARLEERSPSFRRFAEFVRGLSTADEAI